MTKFDPYYGGTAKAAEILGGTVVSLAGGTVGVQYTVEGLPRGGWLIAALSDDECTTGWGVVYDHEDETKNRAWIEVGLVTSAELRNRLLDPDVIRRAVAASAY